MVLLADTDVLLAADLLFYEHKALQGNRRPPRDCIGHMTVRLAVI